MPPRAWTHHGTCDPDRSCISCHSFRQVLRGTSSQSLVSSHIVGLQTLLCIIVIIAIIVITAILPPSLSLPSLLSLQNCCHCRP